MVPSPLRNSVLPAAATPSSRAASVAGFTSRKYRIRLLGEIRGVVYRSSNKRTYAPGIHMTTVVLKMLCDAGWTDAAGDFIATEVLVDLNLDTGLVRPHFENDPDALNAVGPMPVHGLLFAPAGLDDGSSLILHPAWDFAGKARGFHLAYQSLSAHKEQLKHFARRQESLPLVRLRYRSANADTTEVLAA